MGILNGRNSANGGEFRLLGVGSPLLDVLVPVDEAFLETVPGEKGGMLMVEPEFQEDSFLKNAGGNVGTSDRAEINRAVFLQNFRCVVGHDGALFHITCSTPVISIEFHCETEFPGCGLENLYTFIDDFRACSVAGKTSDLVSFYCHFSILGLKIKNLLI